MRLDLHPDTRAEFLERLLSIHRDAMALFDDVEADMVNGETGQRAVAMAGNARQFVADLAAAVRSTVTPEQLAYVDREVERRSREGVADVAGG